MLYSTGRGSGFTVDARNIGALSASAASASSASRSYLSTTTVAAAPAPRLVAAPGVKTAITASRPAPQLAPQPGVDLRAPDPAPAPRKPIAIGSRVSATTSPAVQARAEAIASNRLQPAITVGPSTTGPARSGLSTGAATGGYYAEPSKSAGGGSVSAGNTGASSGGDPGESYYLPEGGSGAPPDSAGTPPGGSTALAKSGGLTQGAAPGLTQGAAPADGVPPLYLIGGALAALLVVGGGIYLATRK